LKPLPINFIAREENRLGEILLNSKGCYSMYKGEGDESNIYYITDSCDPKKIYMMIDVDLWNSIFE
jgi:hypothetical protein